ncbi:uncharacterized protein LOC126757265 isoform X2 [Bactrocera neohumeralis]|uniref:uncharacterized protein LOC126757265 isoform X2 n=1 Tax=Bactrocera neohumeralis TaxID=98809 RepID=UPI0021651B27|nr:uncharacterized protein LOC126757265 isoform X2 [Bactrocera neohumeralis]
MSDSSDYWCDLTLDQETLHNEDAPNNSPIEECLGFDNNVGDSWLYPSNLPERTYQLSIVKTSLFNNTLVVLPTGLGKTFIAAVVMYNIYRWYPTSKVIFMAPTRPLVAQQFEACQRVMPFPDEDTIELTGRLHRNSRKEIWKKKRVFFATPQVVLSDMIADEGKCPPDSNFPFKQVKLIVIDEAHRAKGRYAYTEVVRAMEKRNNYFRVVALSATPGRTMEDIAEVVQNLLISQIEVRCDTSEDVLPYMHKRDMKTVVVQLGNEIKELYAEILSIIDPYLKDLISAQVLRGSLKNISRNFLLFEQKRFREINQNAQDQKNLLVSKNFSFCISMYHALELLERHGIRVFLNFFGKDEDGRSNYVVNVEPKVRHLLDRLRDHFGRDSFEILTNMMVNGQFVKMPDNFDFGHPKFEQARTCLLQHFQTTPNSRAIVFCEYRETVMLMYRLLLQHEPLLKPRYFVGQGGNMGSLRSLTQKQQIKIMDDFRSGKCNILIATSIGEEGIDVGEVELILCFDINTSNPQRFLQRIGRTGRKKQGSVVVLVTEGREEQIFKNVLAQKDLTNPRMLQSMIVNKSLYKKSPRLVPTDVDPKVIRVFIKPTKSKENKKDINSKNRTKKKIMSTPNSMFMDPSQHGVETQQNLEKCLRRIDEYFNTFDDPVASNTQLLKGITCTQKFSHKLNSSQGISLYNSQRFRNLKRVLEKNSTVIPSKEIITNPIEQLKSSKVSNDGKRFILRTQPCIIRNIFDKMKLLEILPLKPDEMSDEEKDIRHLYDFIEKLLGGDLSMEIFIDDADIERLARQRMYRPPSDYDLSDSEYKDVCNTIFDGLEEQGLLCDNFDYIQEELKKTKFYEDSYPKVESDDYHHMSYSPLRNDTDSMVYETVILDEETEISTFGETSLNNNNGDYQPISQSPLRNDGDSMVYETGILDEEGEISTFGEYSQNNESICQNNCQRHKLAIKASNKSALKQGPLAKAFQRQRSKFRNKIQTKEQSLKLVDDNFSTYSNRDKTSDVITLFETSDEDNQVKTRALISGSSKNSEPKCIKPNLNKCSNDCKKFGFISDLSKQMPSLPQSTQNDLDVDINDFLKPFPEETPNESGNKCTSTENYNSEVLGSNTAITPPEGLTDIEEQYRKSSTLFAPLKKEANEFLNTSTNVNLNLEMQSANRPITPPERLPTQPELYEKSPTLFELYLENIKRYKGNMPEHIKQSVAFAEKQIREASSDRHLFSTTNVSYSEEKIISSNVSGETNERAVGSETDCEEFIETQIPNLCTESISNTYRDSSVTNAEAEEGSETECEEITETQKTVDCFRLQRQNRHNQDHDPVCSGDEYSETPSNQYIKELNWNEFTIKAGNKSTPVKGPLEKAFQRQLSKFGNKIHIKRKSLKLVDGNKSSNVIILSDTSDEDYQVETQALISGSFKNSEPKCIKPNLNKCFKQMPSLSKSTQNDLDVDINDFLKPFPEETPDESGDNIPALKPKIEVSSVFTNRPFYSSNFNLIQKGNKCTSSENYNSEVLGSNTAITPPEGLTDIEEQYRKSSTLFAPLKKEANDFLNTSTNVNTNLEVQSPNRLITPPERLSTQSEPYEKSPTISELYLENKKRCKGNMPEHIKQSVAFAEKQIREASSDRHLFSTTNVSYSEEKIISSNVSGETNERAVGSETDCEEFIETQIPNLCTKLISNTHRDSSVTNAKAEEGSETECEEITETQKAVDCFRLQRQNRRRLDNFIDYEAAASGDESDDEMPCSQYIKDSMIVSSDELDTIDENAPTCSQMQAHYLQSIKSPKPIARSTFKIPPFREYNDLSQIYSQMPPKEPSQYVYDSFVVAEGHDKECMKSQNETLSPLERAERILIEQKRARKKFKKVAEFKKRKRIRQVSDSSDDDFIPLK